jgi:Domain of unknown function (DUF2341)
MKNPGCATQRRAALTLGLLAAVAIALLPADAHGVEFWSFRRAVTVSSSSQQSQTSVQVLLQLTPANFDYAAARPDGADLRLSNDPLAGAFDLPFFIESWAPGGTSRIWIRLPSLPANGLATVFLFYGNPVAQPASNFAATFPNRFVSSGDITLSGIYVYDWFELRDGDTLRVAPGQPLSIAARNIIIAGQIDGTGSGYPAGGLPSFGGGPGGGSYSVPDNAGAGGGGHGNTGGSGGYDAGDSPGFGGQAYGSEIDTTNLMGSAGGSSVNKRGGAGGGALTLDAQEMTISGELLLRGAEGQQFAGSSGGGGGGGGGILLRGSRVALTGTLSVRGGQGSNGSNTANDGGGGGAGGRIKIFYKQALANTATIDVGGGAGGAGGMFVGGQSGSNGTLHIATVAYGDSNTTVGARITRTVEIYLPLVTN